MKSRYWDTFLRLTPSRLRDHAPALDPSWLEARGVSGDAPLMFNMLREHLIPLVSNLKPKLWFFLIHDRNSGVPTESESPFIHLHVTFVKARIFTPPAPWELTRPVTIDSSAAGIDATLLTRPSAIRDLLHTQSRFVADMLNSNVSDAGPMKLLSQYRQILHYLANMTQMKIS